MATLDEQTTTGHQEHSADNDADADYDDGDDNGNSNHADFHLHHNIHNKLKNLAVLREKFYLSTDTERFH